MNAEECARLVSVVRALYPAQRFDDNPTNVVTAWGHVVADVTYSEAHAAVVRIARRGTSWVSPGDIRREVASSRNVLTPDVDALLADVREVAWHEGVGRRSLHPVAQRVYESVGGALMITRMDGRGFQQLRRQLEQAAAAFDDRVLDDPLPPPTVPHVAIAARDVGRAPELTGPDQPLKPLDPERAERLRGFVDGPRIEVEKP
jgi:hypothetical protein